MKYVTNIRNPEGEDVKSAFYSVNEEGYVFTVVENEKSKTESSNLNCVGRGISIPGHNVVAVCHSAKTARLQNYVNMAETIVYCKPQSFRVRDGLVLENGTVFNRDIHGNKILCVVTRTDTIKVMGDGGSVVLRKSLASPAPSILTLYDLLIELCKLCNMNLMSYETLQICNAKRGYETLIRLIHNRESERFFLKMYMEACSHE